MRSTNPDDVLNNNVDGGLGIDTAAFILAYNTATFPVLTEIEPGVYEVRSGSALLLATLTGIEIIRLGGSASGAGTDYDIAALAALPRIDLTNGDDDYTGTSANQIINGLDGDDIILGGAGDDIINGDLGNDTLSGGAGNNTLHGYFGNDTLISLGNDAIYGGRGNDTIEMGENVFDVMTETNGGLGIDTISFSTLAQLPSGNLFLVIDLDNQAYSVRDGGTILYVDQFRNFENATGSEYGDLLQGSDSVNVLTGLGGDDHLQGRNGNDTLNGGAGADILNGGGGYDTVDYRGASSRIALDLTTGGTVGEALGDSFISIERVYGSDFNDTITGTSTNEFLESLFGEGGNDTINGGAGNDEIRGGDGSDLLVGGLGADVLDGGAGFDTVDYRGAGSRVALNLVTGGTVGEAAGDTFISIERVYGSDFNDSITGTAANEFLYGEDGNDTINGGDGIDRIYGGDGNDIQRGQGGSDTLYGSAGSDQLNGGTGFDIARYTNAATGVIVNMATGGTGGDAAGDTYFGIEAVYGSGFNDDITGNTSANQLRGLGGDDTLNGGAGNDSLYGGAGADAMDGGTGIDTVFYDDATSGVIVNLDTSGTGGDAAGDTYTSIEWVRGSDFDDDITGEAGNNSIFGNDGNDSLDGWVGNDRLYGGNGDDTINGGQGVDFLYGQNGNDILSGGSENDFFYGSAGGDTMDGGTGTDTVSYLPSSAGVMVNLQTGGSGGDASGDTYTNIERVFGSGFDDTIYGSDGNDVLFGHGGADILGGGLGNDYLSGGAGNDEYVYDTTSGGADTIAGFGSNELIYILGGDADFDTFAEIIAAASNVGANVSFDFGGGNTLTLLGKQITDLDAADFDFSGTAPAAEAPPQDKIATLLADTPLPDYAAVQSGSGDVDTPTDSNDNLIDMFG